MRRILFSLLLLCLLAAVVWAVGGTRYQVNTTVNHVLDLTGNIAEVNKMTSFLPHDGFTYIDTLAPATATPTLTAVSAVMNHQKRRVTPISFVVADTTRTYACSLDCGTNIYGFSWAVPNSAALTLDSIIDTLVVKWNATAGMKDTTAASDSGTYIMITGLVHQDAMQSGARWTLVIDSLAGGTGARIRVGDTSYYATKKRVIDSMVYKINNTAVLSDTLLAANSGDTTYTVTARIPGIDFYMTSGDTAQTVANVTANDAGISSDAETLGTGIAMWEQSYHTLEGNITLLASPTTTGGYGTWDSCIITLWAIQPLTGSRVALVADSGNIPNTLHIALHADTGWAENLQIGVKMWDSATTVAGTRAHALQYNLIATE
jgi:hypothetical protein